MYDSEDAYKFYAEMSRRQHEHELKELEKCDRELDMYKSREQRIAEINKSKAGIWHEINHMSECILNAVKASTKEIADEDEMLNAFAELAVSAQNYTSMIRELDDRFDGRIKKMISDRMQADRPEQKLPHDFRKHIIYGEDIDSTEAYRQICEEEGLDDPDMDRYRGFKFAEMPDKAECLKARNYKRSMNKKGFERYTGMLSTDVNGCPAQIYAYEFKNGFLFIEGKPEE